MRKILLTILAITMLASPLMAQPSTTPQLDNAAIVNDTALLRQITAIRQLQERAREKSDSIWKAHMNKDSQAKTDDEMSNEFGAMLQIADNTRQDPIKDDWNLFGWITFGIALFSLIVGWITYRAQKKTEQHTTNAPIDVQISTLRDLPRHFYRNLVCTCAIILKHNAEGPEKKRKHYPSECNMMKLQTLPDEIVLPIDVQKEAYKPMHEIKLLLRNYNVEVSVATDHISREHISDLSLQQDFDNLLFKPIYLTQRTFEFEKSLPGKHDEDLVIRTILTTIKEHIAKLRITSNFKRLFKATDYLNRMKTKGIDRYFREDVDKTDSLDRSVDLLLKNGRDQAKAVSFVKPSEKNDANMSELEYEAEINSKWAVDSIIKEGQKDKILGGYLLALTSINDEDGFFALCRNYYDDKHAEKDLAALYRSMAPYLTYLSRETWHFHTLLKYMLAIDSAIETDKIGMVNFK